MKMLIPRGISLIFITLLLVACNQTQSKKELHNLGSQQPNDLLFVQRAYPSGQINTRSYSEGIRWKQAQPKNARIPDPIWEFAGPVNIGGRISDIEIDPDNADTYYVGAASGGIFKTINGGGTWTPIFDDQEMLSIGDIEISKSNTDLIVVGTGEVNAGGGSLAYDGDGIYKSTDAGLTWESKGLPDIGSVGKVLIDPFDNDVLYVGAMGPLFRKDNNRGVYKSTDGGDTWTNKLFVSDSTGIIDMVIHPTTPNLIYAASWERIRRPNFRQYGGETSRIYRSTNGGDSWTELIVDLPSAPADKGRISIDISQSNPDVMYALYANQTGSIHGLYRSSNGGNTWTEMNSADLTNVGFHWWFGGIFVDPSDEDVIYNIGFVPQKSIDGGLTWGDSFAGTHVDQHALAFNPSVPGEVLLGNDGGLYLSFDDSTTYIKDETLPITQFYRFYVDPQNIDRLYGGSQDNSTMRTTTGSLGDWDIITGGDGFQPLVDPTNSSVIYTLAQRGFLQKSIDDAASFNIVLSGIDPAENKNWDTPIAFDPANANTLFYGAERLYKTTDGAANWTAISPVLHDGPYAGFLGFGTIISISISPLDSDVIYAGTDDGNVWVTTNGGTTWNNVSASLPDRWVTKVQASRFDVNIVYVTFSGYRFGEDFGHVYKSTNQGTSWTDIGASLPDVPINDIVQDSFGNLFLGTDIGVLASHNEGVNWSPLGINLPSVVVTDLHIQEDAQMLFAATYGRSSYKLDISSDVLSVNDVASQLDVVLYPNPVIETLSIDLPEIGAGQGTLYNSLGQEIMSIQFSDVSKTTTVDLSQLTTGMYFVSLELNGATITKRILKK